MPSTRRRRSTHRRRKICSFFFSSRPEKRTEEKRREEKQNRWILCLASNEQKNFSSFLQLKNRFSNCQKTEINHKQKSIFLFKVNIKTKKDERKQTNVISTDEERHRPFDQWKNFVEIIGFSNFTRIGRSVLLFLIFSRENQNVKMSFQHSSIVNRDDCSYYGRFNSTGFGLIRSYEGIPENLLVNFVVSILLLLLFVYLRRRFSDSKNIVNGKE